MSIGTRIKGAWNAILGLDRSKNIIRDVSLNMMYSQLKNTTDYIQSAYQLNADIYAVASFVANKAAECRLILNRKKKGQDKAFRQYKALKQLGTSDALVKAQVLQTKAVDEIYDHPILDIINDTPNPNMPGSEFKYGCALSRLITGNTYIFGLAPDSNPTKFKELYLLPANETTPMAKGQLGVVQGYRMNLIPGEIIPASDVCHFRYFNPDFQLGNPFVVGQAPLQAAARVVTTSNNATLAEDKAFTNGGAVGVAYVDDGTELTDKQVEQLQEDINSRISGPNNYKSIIASTFKMDYLKMGETPVDLNLIESGLNSLRKICNVFHVSSKLFNDPEGSTYNNMKEARKAAITDAVIPEVNALVNALNKWLIPGWFGADSGYYFEADLSCYPELTEDMDKLVSSLNNSPWLTLNEKRVATNYDTLQGVPMMDIPLVQAGLVPISDLEIDIDTANDEAIKLLKQLDL